MQNNDSDLLPTSYPVDIVMVYRLVKSPSLKFLIIEIKYDCALWEINVWSYHNYVTVACFVVLKLITDLEIKMYFYELLWF